MSSYEISLIIFLLSSKSIKKLHMCKKIQELLQIKFLASIWIAIYLLLFSFRFGTLTMTELGIAVQNGKRTVARRCWRLSGRTLSLARFWQRAPSMERRPSGKRIRHWPGPAINRWLGSGKPTWSTPGRQSKTSSSRLNILVCNWPLVLRTESSRSMRRLFWSISACGPCSMRFRENIPLVAWLGATQS